MSVFVSLVSVFVSLVSVFVSLVSVFVCLVSVFVCLVSVFVSLVSVFVSLVSVFVSLVSVFVVWCPCLLFGVFFCLCFVFFVFFCVFLSFFVCVFVRVAHLPVVDWARILRRPPTASPVELGTGVLWVYTGTHPCGSPSRQDDGETRAPALHTLDDVLRFRGDEEYRAVLLHPSSTCSCLRSGRSWEHVDT